MVEEKDNWWARQVNCWMRAACGGRVVTGSSDLYTEKDKMKDLEYLKTNSKKIAKNTKHNSAVMI
jgi:hypothetical protein